MMSIAEMEEYLLKNKHIRQVITPINISGGVMGVNMKNDGGWKDNLSRIAEAHPTSALADRYGKRSAKEIATRKVKPPSKIDLQVANYRFRTLNPKH